MKRLVEDSQAKEIILGKLIDKFVNSDYTFKNPVTGGIRLIWCNFRNECKVYSTEELFQSQLKIDGNVYFYNERTQELFLCDFRTVQSYVNNLEPWDEIDAEIFDYNLEWIIAVTHEDVSMVYGVDVMIDEYNYEKYMEQ